ncbi:glycosyltransferase [Cereibacter sphaeroides]|uniref:glycosyltransferase n=1 Tax=Cereibacter sphaeroides TaxID=1063 RepID=UPI001F438625|nr:glycosyltransferase [Cereibacter sphaeroides]MCE6950248.1 glycosyltransferase [Cereibacter sphaeroides]MCE6958672.1 glycosyltransferase [Cereibacter sphaeroides]MCE6967564.1 glycosyltransferase [Cereibacter sphaeroides]MCE6973445.1 glycosyltransferase [Cereibacter sphaeroides]
MRSPDRVVILNDASVVRGGATYLATTLARSLRERGLAVTFLAGDSGNPDLGDGIDMVALEGRALIHAPAASALTGLYNAAAGRRIADWIARHDTPGTVYHLHNWSNILSPAVFDALAPVAHRCAIHVHDFFLACPNGAFLDYPRAAVCRRRPLSMACLATQCDKRSYSHKLWRSARQAVLWNRLAPFRSRAQFVMINEAMRPRIEGAVRPGFLDAISNPVEPFGAPVPAPERNLRLVQIGQVQRLKGVFELAEAGRRLGLVVDFIGMGDSLDELRRLYPEHAYHGWMPRDAIGRFLNGARAAVVATQSPEPFCLSAFECVATGLPLVVSESILPARQLEQAGAAVTFRAGDAGALTAVLDRVMRDDALVARLAAAAREKGPGLAPGLAAWISAHDRLYRRLLARSLDPASPRRREAGNVPATPMKEALE